MVSEASSASAPSFPAAEAHRQAWRALARDIALRRASVREQPETSAAKPGELTIIGSGIETVGFTMGDEELLRNADKVFYCVADPATVVWLKRLRPDAYDLYVLYRDDKVRYVTYMQMAESMLHFVREGQRVVSVFYGHPGIFVLSTHRAIMIARREGHRAIMRPGVCALDCLCADLGVDPCHPGLQTHEATDLLVRQRRLDVTLHVVLWQVGLIGEMGFRRQGYINRKFSVLIDYLQAAYGAEYPVTHYVASRYPTIPPLIETYALSELHDPVVQARVTGLSTFYLAPRDAAPADAAMAKKLGLLKPGQTLRTAEEPLRQIGAYGPRELKAFDDFRTFQVPADYHWQDETGGSDFLIALRADTKLQQRYAADAAQALQDPRFARLTPEEARLLASRDSGSIQIAAKGLQRRPRSNHALLAALQADRNACAELWRRLQPGRRESISPWLADYAARRQLDYVEETWANDLAHLARHHLLPWTGVYAASERELSLTVLGWASGRGGTVYVNGRRIRAAAYRHGALCWRAEAGNDDNGFIRFDRAGDGRRALFQAWRPGHSRPDESFAEVAEVDPHRRALAPVASRFLRGEDAAALEGDYTLRTAESKRDGAIRFSVGPAGVAVDGVAVEVGAREPGKLAWSKGPEAARVGQLTFVCNPLTGTPEVFGQVTSGQGSGLACTGTRVAPGEARAGVAATALPPWLLGHLTEICQGEPGAELPFLWQRWEKHHFTSLVLNRIGPGALAGHLYD